MQMTLKSLAGTIVTVSFLVINMGLPGVLAGENKNPVKERQKLMRSVGKAMKTTVKMLRGDLVYDGQTVTDRMKTMSEVAGKYANYFPQGSDMDNSIMDFDQESSAKADIWTNMDDFKMKAKALKTASDEILKVAGDRQAVAGVFNTLGNACKSCHQKYKFDKKE